MKVFYLSTSWSNPLYQSHWISIDGIKCLYATWGDTMGEIAQLNKYEHSAAISSSSISIPILLPLNTVHPQKTLQQFFKLLLLQ